MLSIRCSLINPKILFFDEATSALDNITQKIVSDSLVINQFFIDSFKKKLSQARQKREK